MSDNDNPFKAPETVATVTSTGGDMPLPDNIRLPLLKSAPWQRFVGIMAFVFAGLIALVGLLFMVGVPFIASSFGSAGIGAGMSIFLGIIYMAMGLIYFFPGLYLVRSGKSLKGYQETESANELAASFVSISKFWKFVGVLAIIGAAGMALSIVIMIIAGIASAF
jgi:hypothetical protein